MGKDLAVCLLSGGMDSCVSAAVAFREFSLAFLHVSYGQRTEKRELRAFKEIAEFYGVQKRRTTTLAALSEIGGSSLTDHALEVEKADLRRTSTPATYVPFRNAHLLCTAASWAETIGASKIVIGAVEEDSSGYPDCRESFFKAFNELLRVGTKPETRIEVLTPVIHMKKSEIVKAGMELGAPLHLTWSCYTEEALACGDCDSCALRLRAFKEAGVVDPIPYKNRRSV
jgi:7-cyano-7-deazaguanine synthase